MSAATRLAMPRVLHAAAEVYPLLKTGGLADVAAALPAVLRSHGVDVRMVVPGFPAIREGLPALESVTSAGPAFGAARIALLRGRMPDRGLSIYVLDAPWLFDRPGNPYLAADGQDWPDNRQRFAAFGWAAAHLAWGDLDPDWRADVLHAHDWHAGLAPAYLRGTTDRRVRTVFTVHNLAYQGRFPLDGFRDLGLPAGLMDTRGLEFHGDGSFMKAGLVFSDYLTTVSPRYAEEICTPEFGNGLDGVLGSRRDRLTGILNGIDDRIWNPRTDPHLPARYTLDRLGGKARCKAALQSELGLPIEPRVPMFTMVSRLTSQKGTDLVLAVLPLLHRLGVQLTVLGSGDRGLEAALVDAGRAHPDWLSVQIRYDEAQAHRLIAAADVILVPSRFEPCGLTQMYGLRYGTVPLVRHVGGLADTVVDASEAAIAAGQATGFVFEAAQPASLAGAIERSVSAFREPKGWVRIVRTGMTRDHSWAASARDYVALYRKLLNSRS